MIVPLTPTTWSPSSVPLALWVVTLAPAETGKYDDHERGDCDRRPEQLQQGKMGGHEIRMNRQGSGIQAGNPLADAVRRERKPRAGGVQGTEQSDRAHVSWSIHGEAHFLKMGRTTRRGDCGTSEAMMLLDSVCWIFVASDQSAEL